MNKRATASVRKFDERNQMQVAETMLDLLTELENGTATSQRGLATRLGIALGLTNALVKRCVHKGLLKVREAPARRYAYYLTPAGFAEKSRLTAEYLSTSLQFFRRAREEYFEAAEYCRQRGWQNVALCGGGELTEIALLALNDAGLNVVAIVDPARNREMLFDTRIVRSFNEAEAIEPVAALIVSESRQPQQVYDALIDTVPDCPIVTPRLLRVRRNDGVTSGENAA